MYQKPSYIIITLALVGAAFAEPAWVSFGKGTQGQTPQLTVLESSAAGTAINLETYGMWVENVTEDDETYQRVTLTGSSFVGEVGKPMLPVVRKLVAIPASAGVTVKVEVNSTTTFSDYLVYPAQEPQMGPQPRPEFEIDEEFYSLDTLYPVELSEVGTPAIMNDVRLVELAIEPFCYNPAKKELTVATDLTVSLDYSGFDERNVLTRKSSYFSPQWESIYRTLVLNFDNLYGSVKTSDVVLPVSHYLRYLIIYAHNFRPEVCPMLTSFIEWKTHKGCIVDAIDLNSINGIDGQANDVQDVKTHIYNWANPGYSYPGPVSRYVLLVGDAPNGNPNSSTEDEGYYLPWVQSADNSHIPTYADEWHIPEAPQYKHYYSSDYFYQCLTEDQYPDVCVGRWCPRNLPEFEVYLYKNSVYENPDPTWTPNKALFVAGDSWVHMKTAIDSEIMPEDYLVIPQYGSPYEGTNQGVINAIQTAGGVGIVNYGAHGDSLAWLTWSSIPNESWTVGDVHNLDQSAFNGYPVVYATCCSNGQITNPWVSECIVEAWTHNPNGGATGAFGASKPSSFSSNEVLDSSLFRGHFGLNLNCGMAINFAETAVMLWALDPTDIWGASAKMYHWIGDPELDIWRAYPVPAHIELTVSFPDLLNVDVLKSSDNSPIPNTQVCIHREGGGYHDVKFTAMSGRVTFTYPSAPGTYRITATNQRGPICIRPASSQLIIYGGGGQETPLSDIVEWQLKPASPNPFQSSVVISYSVGGTVGLKENQFVDLAVFDVSGKKVKVLTSDSYAPGHYTLTWNGCDDSGRRLPSGIYFIRLDSNEFGANEKIVLLK